MTTVNRCSPHIRKYHVPSYKHAPLTVSIPPKFLLFFVLMLPATSFAEQTITAIPVSNAPVIDGSGNDRTWSKATPIITHDKVADIDITLTAVYTDKEIFFKVSFPDPDESRTHKSWTWDHGRGLYSVGLDREDVFVFKWNMNEAPVDLSIYSDTPYMADIWFWKACRTDPVGYADDKTHTLGQTVTPQAMRVISKSEKTMYLLRYEDRGKGSYSINFIVDFQDYTVPRYIITTPAGSRADVEAKGVWNNGTWTIEFARDLITGNDDDVQFNTEKIYQFGLSRYEIAGRPANQMLTQPLYGQGDVSETLFLKFAPVRPSSK